MVKWIPCQEYTPLNPLIYSEQEQRQEGTASEIRLALLKFLSKSKRNVIDRRCYAAKSLVFDNDSL